MAAVSPKRIRSSNISSTGLSFSTGANSKDAKSMAASGASRDSLCVCVIFCLHRRNGCLFLTGRKSLGQIMNTTETGNKLEDKLYDYLLDQQNHDSLVYDAHPAACCEVHKKKKYYCKVRERYVEFDVVVEVRRIGRTEPHLYLVFECKNHQRPIEEIYLSEFSSKISSVFGHAVKGVVIASSRLQTGAASLARNSRLGIAKFDGNGIEVIADRSIGAWTENRFIQTQIFDGHRRSKSLKFSACVDGIYFSSFNQMLCSFETDSTDARVNIADQKSNFVAFLREAEIQDAAQDALSLSGYNCGQVDVEKLCNALGFNLSYSEQEVQDADGNSILGSANFAKRSIEINTHGNRNRERFTVAHEIGHFCLRHDKYLRADSIVEQDLYHDAETDDALNYERLEYQANLFASLLLLPDKQFRKAVELERNKFETYGRTFGYIFVDDQPCNYAPYNQMLAELSDQFGASKKAIEIRLKRADLVTDNRVATVHRSLPLTPPRPPAREGP